MTAHAVEAGVQGENLISDAAGPETICLEELLWLLAEAVGAAVLVRVRRGSHVFYEPKVGTGWVNAMLRSRMQHNHGRVASSPPWPRVA